MKYPGRVETYLEHIAAAIDRITSYVQEVNGIAEFLQNQKTQDAVVRNIEIIGEAVNKIQKASPDFIAAHPEIPWAAMRTMRNKVIHDYFQVDAGIIWSTVKTDLPQLRQQVEHLFAQPKLDLE